MTRITIEACNFHAVVFRTGMALESLRVFRGGRLDLGKAFVCMDRLLDECRTGPTYLRLPGIAQILADRILRQGADYDCELHAWVAGANRAALRQDESCDHLVRDADEFHRIENDILENPVRAGLAGSAEEYRWCGVSKRAG